MTARIAVLASGGGSNLQAILDYLETQGDSRAGTVALVASDRPSARALDRARHHGVPALALDASQRESGLAAILHAHTIDYVALAGYLRFIPIDVTREWRGRLVNVHPSLLPSFGGTGMYGMRVHQAVISAGVRLTGVTVHFVDEQYDRGPIIAQWPVVVNPDDTPETLAARVLDVEHSLYPLALDAVVQRRVTLGSDGRVNGLATAPELAASPSLPQRPVSTNYV